MDIQELIRSLLSQAGAKSVYGDPISAEGKTIVPVARVRCGFGGGSGRKAAENEGGGGGGGFVARPVGYIEVTSTGTRFSPIIDAPTIAQALAVGVCFGLLVGGLARR
jgi:uncharacterized spore protein YtfJ